MKTLKIIALAITVLLDGQVFAQNKGYNRIDVSYVKTWTTQSEESLYYDRNGVGLDYMHGFKLSKKHPLYFEIGGRLILAYDNSVIDHFDPDLSLSFIHKYHSKFLSLGAPINLCYKININKNLCIIPQIGLYSRGFLMARTEQKSTKYKKGEFSEQEVVDYNMKRYIKNGKRLIKRFHSGWNIGASIQYKKFILGSNIGTGLIKTRGNYTMCEFTVSAGFVL